MLLGEFMATPGPAILHAVINPDEIPAMPHIKFDQAFKFGIAKIREKLFAGHG